MKKDELREQFITQVEILTKYWEKTETSRREALEGVAFSILNMLDGNSGDIPPFAVVPIDEEGTIHIDEDIAGYLHEIVFQNREEN